MKTIDVDNTRRLLEEIGQGHLLTFWGELTLEQRGRLLEQIQQLDVRNIPRWVRETVKNEKPLVVPTEFEPAPSYPPVPQTPEQAKKYAQARQIGEKLLREGKVAGFVVAGGQGTRLGFDGPKGNYSVSPIKKKTLFRIFAESVAAARKKYGAVLPWLIMTSPLNHKETVETFETNNYFGLGKDTVFLFQQGTLPNFDFEGRIFLAEKDTIAVSPDGHGGSLKALYSSGVLAEMKKRGVEYLSYWQIDNPLVQLFDPLFLGLHVMEGAGMSSKALIKAHPLEKVGNFCLVNGRVTVIEYSDLPDEQAHRRNPDGSLVFELGSIAIHILSREFVERLNADGDFALPLHRAVKKIPHIDLATGKKVNPDKPCGIKLETFIFDALPLSEKSVILQTIRSEEFAPVKNASGEDSPAVTERMMIERAASWLEKAGVKVPRTSDGQADCVLEMAPSFALTAEDVKAKVHKVPPIRPGDRLYLE
ncbi:MAG TPA: UDPGP type 1 family protein [Anaerohalosphaeraceae bacterium]|nr:UDPGP type 1 family protein [Anaerohalosphaeraceae bacterium]